MNRVASRICAAAFLCCLANSIVSAESLEPYQDRLLRDHLWRQVVSLPPGERPTVGLVLSAGGFRGMAHVGVIEVLEEAGFPVDVVAGASMGAVVGALYAGGLPLSRMATLSTVSTLESGSNFNRIRLFWLMMTDHLLSSKKMEKFVQDLIKDKNFYELKKPFACVAMDIKTGESIIFHEGPVATAVRASMNLPGFFSPVEYRHRYLVDGGVVDYIPIDAAKLLGADWIIASVTEGDYTRLMPTNVLMALEQVIDIRGALLARQERRQANFIIEPQVGDILFFQSERGREAVGKGVIAARERLQGAKESLILFSLPRLVGHWRKAP